jgi:hypothetical protein
MRTAAQMFVIKSKLVERGLLAIAAMASLAVLAVSLYGMFLLD